MAKLQVKYFVDKNLTILFLQIVFFMRLQEVHTQRFLLDMAIKAIFTSHVDAGYNVSLIIDFKFCLQIVVDYVVNPLTYTNCISTQYSRNMRQATNSISVSQWLPKPAKGLHNIINFLQVDRNTIMPGDDPPSIHIRPKLMGVHCLNFSPLNSYRNNQLTSHIISFELVQYAGLYHSFTKMLS